jgi:hypothetical protein
MTRICGSISRRSLPFWSVSSSPSSAAWSSITSAIWFRRARLSPGVVPRHASSSNARRAAETASSMSSAVPSGTLAHPSPLYGKSTTIRSSPLDSRNLPSMYSSYSWSSATGRSGMG